MGEECYAVIVSSPSFDIMLLTYTDAVKYVITERLKACVYKLDIKQCTEGDVRRSL